MDYFKEYAISESDIERLKNFTPRDELFTINENEFGELAEAFSTYMVIDKAIPVLTDNESNFICVYTKGTLKGKVFCNQHDDTMLAPLFHNLSSFLDFIDNNPQFTQCYQFSNYWRYIEYWDYPAKNEQYKNENLEIIKQLQNELNASDNPFEQDCLAFSIMALTPYSSIEDVIYPLLGHEDFYIPEFASNMLAYHRYVPAIPVLEELQKTAKSNAKTAVDKALQVLKNIKA